MRPSRDNLNNERKKNKTKALQNRLTAYDMSRSLEIFPPMENRTNKLPRSKLKT